MARTNPNRAFAVGLLTGREDARVEAAMQAACEAYAELARSSRSGSEAADTSGVKSASRRETRDRCEL